MRRKDRKMEQKDALEIVKNCQWAMLSMVNCRSDYPLGPGSPYTIPVSPVFLDGSLYFHCAEKGHKMENLRKDNRVCLSCVGQAENDELGFSVAYTSALVFALAFEVVEAAEKQKAFVAICKKYAPSQGERIEQYILNHGSQAVLWRLEPVEMSGKQRKFESQSKV
jgi:nitroimidazol reductase NimA-like FMN-containing flavoprotein (pyridoxamine 5'-phosphate oxidase superfamily)